MINLVQQLPEDLFLESAPSSPTMPSALASTDSLNSDPSLAASSVEPGGARANIIKELVDTERKYVQDLEVMQVRVLAILRARGPSSQQRLPFPKEILRRGDLVSRSRHAPSPVPRAEQAPELSEKVPHQGGEHCGGTLERTTMGSSLQ